MSLDTSKQQCA